MEMNISDYVTLVNMIDACSERGAFKGPELLTIGTVRDKMVKMIEVLKQDQPKQ